MWLLRRWMHKESIENSENIIFVVIRWLQGRPVRALCDAEMHHGQCRREQKTNKVCKNT